MPVHNDFEERFVSRLSGICSGWGDTDGLGGWDGSGPGTNSGGNSGGGHQGNGGEGNWRDNLPGKPGSGYYGRPPGTSASKPPSVTGNKDNNSGTSSPPDDGTRGGQNPNHPSGKQILDIVQQCGTDCAENQLKDELKDRHKNRNKPKGRKNPKSTVLDRMNDAIKKGDEFMKCQTECVEDTLIPLIPKTQTNSSSLKAPALPDHPNITRTGYSVVGYNRLRTHRDGEDYRINAFSKISGYNVPAGKELIQFYNKVYIIPDAASRRRTYS